MHLRPHAITETIPAPSDANTKSFYMNYLEPLLEVGPNNGDFQRKGGQTGHKRRRIQKLSSSYTSSCADDERKD